MWKSLLLLYSVLLSTTPPVLLAKISSTEKSGSPDPPLYPLVYLRRTAGGLGNQLFQYACAYSIANKLDIPFNIHVPEDIITARNRSSSTQSSLISKYYTDTKDRTFALQLFPNIHLNYSSEVDNYVINHDNVVVPLDDRMILKGKYPAKKILSVDSYCQSEKYFTPYQDDIRHLYFMTVTTDNVKKWIKKIHSVKESVSVHIRRGDFDRNIHRRVGIQYYFKAMKLLAKTRSHDESLLSFFIFSDDIEAVKVDFSKSKEVNWNEDPLKGDKDSESISLVFDGNEYPIYWVSSAETKLSNIEEFYLMTRCSHNIISTSTFGWWTAYLNPNPDKMIIAAKHNPLMYIGDYFHDEQFMNWYYPSNWTILDVKYDWS